MLTIDVLNNIKLTRGDTLTLHVELIKDGAPYVPEEGDVIRFALSKAYLTQSGYELLKEVEIPGDTLTFTLSATDTKTLNYGTYNYDIQITHEDGAVDTFISAKLVITEEVE